MELYGSFHYNLEPGEVGESLNQWIEDVLPSCKKTERIKVYLMVYFGHAAMERYLNRNVRPREEKARAALERWAVETKTHRDKDGAVWKVPEIIVATNIS